jgi:hypothetical protein
MDKTRRLIYRASNQVEESKSIIPMVIIFLNLIVSPLSGAIMAIRGAYDGRISIVGSILRVVYFFIFLFAIYYDERYESSERWARMLPPFFGAIVIGVQLTGVFATYECSTVNIRTCI